MLIPILWDILDLRNFFKVVDPVARWTAVVGTATVALVIATIYNAIILRITDDTLQYTVEAANRAWLAPSRGDWTRPVEHAEGLPPLSTTEMWAESPRPTFTSAWASSHYP
ncbi:hypothetical protein [Bradyrhizobium sp. URHC0002]